MRTKVNWSRDTDEVPFDQRSHRAMGVKEFASKVRMASPNVLRAINTRHNPTQETMNRLLKPFRLKLSLARIDRPGSRHAA